MYAMYTTVANHLHCEKKERAIRHSLRMLFWSSLSKKKRNWKNKFLEFRSHCRNVEWLFALLLWLVLRYFVRFLSLLSVVRQFLFVASFSFVLIWHMATLHSLTHSHMHSLFFSLSLSLVLSHRLPFRTHFALILCLSQCVGRIAKQASTIFLSHH